MQGKNFDIFISYRRSDGSDKARAITETLKGKNYRCFLDFDKLKGGKFDERIEKAIKDAPVFIAVMTPDYLVRPKEDEEKDLSEEEKDNQGEDWVYKEIEIANANNKYIISIDYNGKIKSIPKEVPASISKALGAHTFAEVYDGQKYESDMESLIKGWISEIVPPPTEKTQGKANIEVSSDADCDILKAGEVIATIAKGGYNILKLSQGRHRLVCRSNEFSDIEQKVILEVNKDLAEDFIDVELADKIMQRRIEIEEEEKRKKEEEERRRREEEERIAAEKAEQERLEQERRLAEQRLKVERARLEVEKAEKERLESLKRDSEKISGSKKIDIFICYRRSDGTHKARILDSYFREKGYRTFLDYNRLTDGGFDEIIEQVIKDSSVFIMVITPDFFSRCNQEGDWVRKEIEIALKNGITIVPINIDGAFNGFPDYLDEHFKILIGAHFFERVFMDSRFEYCMESLLEQRINPWFPTKQNQLIPPATTVPQVPKVESISPSDFRLLRNLDGHSDRVVSVAVSPDGKYLASASHDNTIKIWDAKSGECLRTLKGHLGNVSSVSWSTKGKYLVSGSHDNTLKLWDLGSGECLLTLEGHLFSVRSVSWSPDGRFLASGSWDGILKLWDLGSGKCIRTLKGHSGSVISVSWSPDGKYLASGSLDRTIKLWDSKSGECIRTLKGYSWNVSSVSSYVSSVSWSPDGRYLASGLGDGILKLWDAKSGECIRTLYGYLKLVSSVSWSPDGKWLASGSNDDKIKIWDSNSGECMQTLEGHSGDVRSVCWSPDGKYLASGSDDETVKIWGVE